MQRHCDQHGHLGWAALAMQRASLAEQHLVECLRIAREYGLSPFNALVYLAQTAALQGDRARCARLMGAAAGVWAPDTRVWSRLAMSEQGQCQAAIAEAESAARLGEPAMAAAWSQGWQMTLDQAVEYALRGSEVNVLISAVR